MRVEVTTEKEIRPDQLQSELGGGAEIFTSEGVVQAEGVSKQALEQAVSAHTPNPDFGVPQETLNLRAAVDTLRQWSDDAQGAYDDWPNKTAGQKDAVNREVIRRLGVFFDNFADLLVHQRIE